MLVDLSILVLLIILNAFFAASEIALVTLNDNKVKIMAEEGNKKAKKILKLLSEPSKFLATIQIGITLAGFLASAFAAGTFAEILVEFLIEKGINVPINVLQPLSVVIVTIILSYFTLVLGELVPKRIAMQKAEKIAMLSIGPILFLSKITSPFVKFLTFSTNTVVKLFGIDPNKENEEVTEEEIRMLIDVGEEKGTIDEEEKRMLHNVFEFDNKIVSDIMTHRTNINAFSIDSTLKEIVSVVEKEKYTRYPVYKENIDEIVGILHVKDLIKYLESEDKENFDLSNMLHEANFVMKMNSLDDVFKMMKDKNVHMLIAIDEYGGTDGVLTVEDIIEEIVGNIFDEYDAEEMKELKFEEIDKNTYVLKGSVLINDINEKLGLSIPNDEYDTISGFVVGKLGYYLDNEGENVYEYENLQFIIKSKTERKIEELYMKIKEEKVIEEKEVE